MEKKDVRLIKIQEKEVAEQLIAGGFLCIEETINEGQTIYVFEKSSAFVSELEKIRQASGFYSGIKIIEDNTLSF